MFPSFVQDESGSDSPPGRTSARLFFETSPVDVNAVCNGRTLRNDCDIVAGGAESGAADTDR